MAALWYNKKNDNILIVLTLFRTVTNGPTRNSVMLYTNRYATKQYGEVMLGATLHDEILYDKMLDDAEVNNNIN